MDPSSLLGVTHHNDHHQLKSRFRKLASYHQAEISNADVEVSNQAKKMLVAVYQAYRLLLDSGEGVKPVGKVKLYMPSDSDVEEVNAALAKARDSVEECNNEVSLPADALQKFCDPEFVESIFLDTSSISRTKKETRGPSSEWSPQLSASRNASVSEGKASGAYGKAKMSLKEVGKKMEELAVRSCPAGANTKAQVSTTVTTTYGVDGSRTTTSRQVTTLPDGTTEVNTSKVIERNFQPPADQTPDQKLERSSTSRARNSGNLHHTLSWQSETGKEVKGRCRSHMTEWQCVTDMSSDLYGLLGVRKDVSESDLKKAYRRLALRWHPDKNMENTEQASVMFKKVSEAYATLSNPRTRCIYDRGGGSAIKTIGHSFRDVEEAKRVFEEVFGGGASGRFSADFNMNPMDDMDSMMKSFGLSCEGGAWDSFGGMTGLGMGSTSTMAGISQAGPNSSQRNPQPTSNSHGSVKAPVLNSQASRSPPVPERNPRLHPAGVGEGQEDGDSFRYMRETMSNLANDEMSCGYGSTMSTTVTTTFNHDGSYTTNTRQKRTYSDGRVETTASQETSNRRGADVGGGNRQTMPSIVEMPQSEDSEQYSRINSRD